MIKTTEARSSSEALDGSFLITIDVNSDMAGILASFFGTDQLVLTEFGRVRVIEMQGCSVSHPCDPKRRHGTVTYRVKG